MRDAPLVRAALGIVLATGLAGGLAAGCRARADRELTSPAPSAATTTDARAQHVTDLLARLDRALRDRAPQILERLRPSASEEQLVDFEKYLGMRMPDALRAMYRWHDGVNTNVHGRYQPPSLFPGYWMSSLEQVRESHAMKTRMSKDGTYERTGRGGAGWWDARWIPVFANDVGGSLCVDMAGSFTGVKGQLLEEWHDDASRSVDYRSIDAWLETYVTALEAGILKATSDDPCSIEASDRSGEEGPKHERWLAFQRERNPGYPRHLRAVGGH